MASDKELVARVLLQQIYGLINDALVFGLEFPVRASLSAGGLVEQVLFEKKRSLVCRLRLSNEAL